MYKKYYLEQYRFVLEHINREREWEAVILAITKNVPMECFWKHDDWAFWLNQAQYYRTRYLQE